MGLMFLACYFASFHTPTLPVRTFDSTVSGLRRKTVISMPQSRCNAFARFVCCLDPTPPGLLPPSGSKRSIT